MVDIIQKIRSITPEIFKKYSYGKDENGNHVIQHYNYNGEKSCTKIRTKDKEFYWEEDYVIGFRQNCVPFGLNLFSNGGKKITITQGEIDCLSVAQAFNGKYPVISINNGIEKAKEDLALHITKINSFEEIILWFNNDERSQEVAREVATLFTPGKTKIVQSIYKDANEVLIKKGPKGVSDLFWEAREISPIGIVNAADGGFESFMADTNSDNVYDTLYHRLEISKGSITTFVSGTGMGKTTMVKEISYDLLMRHKLKIGYVGLEESNQVSKRGFIGIHLNKQLVKKKNWKEFKDKKENEEILKSAYEEVLAKKQLYLFDHFGSLDSDILIDKLRYLAVGAECDFIILDHISIVVSGQQTNGNDTKVIDILMTKLRSLVEETGVGMILISHLKRIEGNKGHEDGAKVSLSHLRGSGSIAQISDKVIGLEGDQQGEKANVRKIRMLKDREAGETGILSEAKYNKETGRLLPINKNI